MIRRKALRKVSVQVCSRYPFKVKPYVLQRAIRGHMRLVLRVEIANYAYQAVHLLPPLAALLIVRGARRVLYAMNDFEVRHDVIEPI